MIIIRPRALLRRRTLWCDMIRSVYAGWGSRQGWGRATAPSVTRRPSGCHPSERSESRGSAPRLDAATPTRFHAEFAEVRGVRGASFENPPQRPRYIHGSVRKDFGARSPRRDAEPRRTARGSGTLQRCSAPLHAQPQNQDFGVGIRLVAVARPPRSSANSAGRGGGGVQGASLRELRVNHVARRCPSAGGADPSTARYALRSG